MAGLKECPFCGSNAGIEVYDASPDPSQWTYTCGCQTPRCRGNAGTSPHYFTKEEAADEWNRRERETCVYIPECTELIYDDEGNETDTGYPDEECDVFICSKCGGEMMCGDGGWFGEYPTFRPYFKFCPYCGARVENDR